MTTGMVVAAREPRANAAFLRLPRSGNHHDLGLFQVGTAATPKRSRGIGLYHLAWQLDTIDELAEIRQAVNDAGAYTASPATARSLLRRLLVPSCSLAPFEDGAEDLVEVLSPLRVGELTVEAEGGADGPRGHTTRDVQLTYGLELNSELVGELLDRPAEPAVRLSLYSTSTWLSGLAGPACVTEPKTRRQATPCGAHLCASRRRS